MDEVRSYGPQSIPFSLTKPAFVTMNQKKCEEQTGYKNKPLWALCTKIHIFALLNNNTELLWNLLERDQSIRYRTRWSYLDSILPIPRLKVSDPMVTLHSTSQAVLSLLVLESKPWIRTLFKRMPGLFPIYSFMTYFIKCKNLPRACSRVVAGYALL